ncbi:MAG: hypothetical protein U0T84_01875 [Chitinophagales bacterium]
MGILRFLKSNSPILLALNVLLVLLTRLIFVVAPVDVDRLWLHHEPLAALTFSWLRPILPDAAFVAVGAVVSMLLSLMLNQLVNENKVATKRTYLPGILFLVFAGFFNEFLIFSPAQIALYFLFRISSKVFRLTRPEKHLGDIFDTGLLSMLSTLFYFPSIVYVPLALIGIYTMRPFSFRDLWLVLSGFLTALFCVFCYYYGQNRPGALVLAMLNFLNGHSFEFGMMQAMDIARLVWLGLLLLAAIVLVQGVLYSSSIQTRKYTGYITITSLAIIIGAVLAMRFDYSHLVLLTLPLGFLWSLLFVESRDSLFLDITFVVLFLSAPGLQWAAVLFIQKQ